MSSELGKREQQVVYNTSLSLRAPMPTKIPADWNDDTPKHEYLKGLFRSAMESHKYVQPSTGCAQTTIAECSLFHIDVCNVGRSPAAAAAATAAPQLR